MTFIPRHLITIKTSHLWQQYNLFMGFILKETDSLKERKERKRERERRRETETERERERERKKERKK